MAATAHSSDPCRASPSPPCARLTTFTRRFPKTRAIPPLLRVGPRVDNVILLAQLRIGAEGSSPLSVIGRLRFVCYRESIKICIARTKAKIRAMEAKPHAGVDREPLCMYSQARHDNIAALVRDLARSHAGEAPQPKCHVALHTRRGHENTP